ARVRPRAGRRDPDARGVGRSVGPCGARVRRRPPVRPARHRARDPAAHPRELERAAPMPGPTERFDSLDGAAAQAIARADTFFVATAARIGEPTGGVDVSHRGGAPGFIRVDGDVLTIPDFKGNRYFNTLGNLVSEPRAALLFIDFATGVVLHVQGATEIQWDGPEVRALHGAERLWRVRVERGWRRRAALPVRWSPPLTSRL